MRPIFINGRFLSQPVTGAQRYGHELLDTLDSYLADSDSPPSQVKVLVPSGVEVLPAYRCLSVRRVGKFSGQVWEQLELPFHARSGLLFTPCGGAPIVHRRNVITIHDAAVIASPQGYSRAFRTWYQLLNWTLCHSALHVFTVSHFSKAELVKWYRANPKKTTVTYLGSEHALRPAPEIAVLGRNLLQRYRYVLLVASRNHNKNIAGLLRAVPYITDPKLQIAIAGHSDARVFGEIKIRDKRVHDLGYVNDSELRSLYENAACFVFPSFYEGFGLPPLEALALGCPTVVAETTSLQEIFAGVALMCDPNDPADIADKIMMSLNATEEQRAGNREFAAKFRWDACARTTWEALSRLAAS